MADRYQDRSWNRDTDWDRNTFDNLSDVNLENVRRPRGEDYWRAYNNYWRNRAQDRGFEYYAFSNLSASNLDRPVGRRRNYGSRFGEYYQRGMPMCGYAYDYEYGKGVDNWRDANLEDFGRINNEENSFGRGFDYDWQGKEYQPQFRYREFWNIPGPYTGSGPRGYQRSDDRIREDVCERLSQHGQIDATGISVDVRQRQVFLTGTVIRKGERRIAEDIAASVTGVQDVRNSIQVQDNDGVRVRGVGQEEIAMFGRIKQGMHVIGRNGEFIGLVKQVRNHDFLVDRPKRRDVFVPFSAVRKTNGDIELRVAATDISDQGWQHPEPFRSEEYSRDWRQSK